MSSLSHLRSKVIDVQEQVHDHVAVAASLYGHALALYARRERPRAEGHGERAAVQMTNLLRLASHERPRRGGEDGSVKVVARARECEVVGLSELECDLRHAERRERDA